VADGASRSSRKRLRLRDRMAASSSGDRVVIVGVRLACRCLGSVSGSVCGLSCMQETALNRGALLSEKGIECRRM